MTTEVQGNAAAACPAHAGRDDRKTAAIAEGRLTPHAGSRVVNSFFGGREILRSTKVRQGGAAVDSTDLSKPGDISFFFLDGELHRKRRAAVAGMFAPKAIATRHRGVMDRTMDEIIAKLHARGAVPLDELSWQMAVDVAAEIIGLTNSANKEELALRVASVLDSSATRKPGWFHTLVFNARMLVRVGRFWKNDLAPAIAARKLAPQDDVISKLLADGASKKGIIMECLSYGGAGMMTTREFIVMAAWHMFEKDALRERFLNGGEEDQFAILEEILRLEPVAALLHRRVAETAEGTQGGDMQEGELICVNLRAANVDEAITGPCPFELDPDRAKRMKVVGPYLSFGDGPHRCPGAQVALHETRVFLERLFRLPGIRMVSEPQIIWNAFIQGYELRGAVVTCDPA